MGMYTELNISVNLDYSKIDKYRDILRFMTGESDVDASSLTLPDHPLFQSDRWEYMLRCRSAYFAGVPHATLEVQDEYERVSLTSLSNLKNYSGEIGGFCDWISQYVDYGCDSDDLVFGGYKRYEEDIVPTLIYFKDGSAVVKVPDVDVSGLLSEKQV